MSQTVLVTGASSGIGKAIAWRLAERGFTVFGTTRTPVGSSSHGVAMVRLDVRSDDSVRACVDHVLVPACQAGRAMAAIRRRSAAHIRHLDRHAP